MLRIIRNVIIAILSAGWILPLLVAVECLHGSMLYFAESDYETFREFAKFDHSLLGAYILSKWALIWLGVVIAFWSFLGISKIWPIKRGRE